MCNFIKYTILIGLLFVGNCFTAPAEGDSRPESGITDPLEIFPAPLEIDELRGILNNIKERINKCRDQLNELVWSTAGSSQSKEQFEETTKKFDDIAVDVEVEFLKLSMKLLTKMEKDPATAKVTMELVKETEKLSSDFYAMVNTIRSQLTDRNRPEKAVNES